MDLFEIEGMERLEELQTTTRRAAEIIADSMDKGPLHTFLVASRDRANIAMDKFAYADVTKVSDLTELQVQVRTYIDLLHWMEMRLEAGRSASQWIDQEFNQPGEVEEDD